MVLRVHARWQRLQSDEWLMYKTEFYVIMENSSIGYRSLITLADNIGSLLSEWVI